MVCDRSTSLNSPDSAAGVSVGRPAYTESCSLAGSEPRMSPLWSAGTGTDHDEHQLQSDTPYNHKHTQIFHDRYMEDCQEKKRVVSYRSGLPSVLRTNILLTRQSLIISNGLHLQTHHQRIPQLKI